MEALEALEAQTNPPQKKQGKKEWRNKKSGARKMREAQQKAIDEDRA